MNELDTDAAAKLAALQVRFGTMLATARAALVQHPELAQAAADPAVRAALAKTPEAHDRGWTASTIRRLVPKLRLVIRAIHHAHLNPPRLVERRDALRAWLTHAVGAGGGGGAPPVITISTIPSFTTPTPVSVAGFFIFPKEVVPSAAR